MTVRNLDALFRPKSVAVIGASARPESVGGKVWRRVLAGGFEGPVWPVNPKYAELDGYAAFSDAADLLEAPCVALICTPCQAWSDVVGKLGRLGTRAAIIVSDAKREEASPALARALAAAKPHLLRIVGPGSLGVVTPALNAHLGAPSAMVRAGGVAWVSQSNALTNAVLGWAQARGLGFSHAIALGGEADVDAGDVLDYLASDPGTRAILLELSVVRAARKFMSAARAAARNKPVLVLRTGRADPADALYAAAFRRAGMVRVDSLDDLIDEIETLGVGRIAASSSATLVTSDRGVAALAADAFAAAGTTLADWSGTAAAAVSSALPHVVPGNPLVLGNDARPEHFGLALEALAPHRDTGTAFVVHASTLGAPVADVARVLIEHQRFAYRGLLACFFGGVDETTRDALRAHGIAVHSTPHRLARAFARLVDYRLGRELLMQTPQGLPAQVPAAVEATMAQAKAALDAGRTVLAGDEAAQLLQGFGLEIVDMEEAHAVGRGKGDEHIVDVAVTLRDDAEFGPIFEFTAPPADGSSAPFAVYGLLPLNPVLAREIVSRSPYARRAPVGPVLHALTALSEAVCCVEQIVGLTAALTVTRTHARLATPRIVLGPVRGRLAIVPYPRELEETLDWHGQRVTIRPVRPEDEPAHSAFVAAMTRDDLRLRFFGAVSGFDHTQLARMTQIDYDREMALIATTGEGGRAVTLGVVRTITDPDNECAEFAVAVRSDLKGKGLGRTLMERMVAYVRGRGTRWIVGEVLRENAPMLGLVKALGFAASSTADPAVVEVKMPLRDDARAP
ncbi:bifunctional acetate--CoA ligase family protein/GNAT family N-acetyltransferase [Trinickia acidisoli]|uniref:bifunctional acetate--CoA ligase family protein/GNAT family N-acetyltransferase n=1 Tax=Trinickia acidisoli TaxID=2767482 RepID=UPI001A8D8EB2|nr:GNAT family N-acetyltransferase [Trinickia acidisoli]